MCIPTIRCVNAFYNFGTRAWNEFSYTFDDFIAPGSHDHGEPSHPVRVIVGTPSPWERVHCDVTNSLARGVPWNRDQCCERFCMLRCCSASYARVSFEPFNAGTKTKWFVRDFFCNSSKDNACLLREYWSKRISRWTSQWMQSWHFYREIGKCRFWLFQSSSVKVRVI